MRSTFTRYLRFSAVVAMLLIGAASASAQKIAISTATNQTLRSSLLTPLATASFAPLSFGGTFNGSPVTMTLGSVSLSDLVSPITLGMGSVIAFGTPQGIGNGNYSMVITVPWANMAMSLQLVRGATEVASCTIQQQLSYAAGAPVQQCDTGPFTVGEGNLNLTLRIKNPNPTCQTCVAFPQQVNVSQVTLNLWR